MQGITRIQIISDNRKYDELCDRVKNSYKNINALYREILPIMDNECVEEVELNDLHGTYDWQEGIDIILYLRDGSKLTLQEKILTKGFNTITFEEKKGYGKLGAWYYCTAQLYFCCEINSQYSVTAYALIDLARIKIMSNQGLIHWKYRTGLSFDANEFRFINLADIPESCIIARKL